MCQGPQVSWGHLESVHPLGQLCFINLILRLRLKMEQLLGRNPSRDREDASRSTSGNMHCLLLSKMSFQRGRSQQCLMSERHQAAVTLSLPPICYWPKQDTWSRPISVMQESPHFPWRLGVALGGRSGDKLNNNLLQLHT